MEEYRLWVYNLAKKIQSKLSLVKVMPELKDDLFPSESLGYYPFAIICF